MVVVGLGLLVAFAFFWTSSDRAATDRAEALALQRRGITVIERQGGTTVEWFGRPGYERRASCWGFTAQRLGGRAQGAYCETTHDRYVIWDADRHAP